MDKIKRKNLMQAGMIILRAQYDGKKEVWIVAKSTWNGGWSKFGHAWYHTREDAEAAIDRLVAANLREYVKDC